MLTVDHATRTCQFCEEEYFYPFEGGYKYHHECAPLAKKEQDKVGGYLITAEEAEDRSYEYFFNFACGTCGMKYRTKKAAHRCCARVEDGRIKEPIYQEGGFWINSATPWRALQSQMTRGPLTGSRSHGTSSAPSSRASTAEF